MNKDCDEKNKEKLVMFYNTIPDNKKENFLDAVYHLCQCFLINNKKSNQ